MTNHQGAEPPSAVRQLRRAALAGPLVLLAVVEAAHWALAPVLSPWAGRLIIFAAALALLAIFYDQIFGRLEMVELRLKRQNQELLGLHVAGLAITADLSLDTVLQT